MVHGPQSDGCHGDGCCGAGYVVECEEAQVRQANVSLGMPFSCAPWLWLCLAVRFLGGALPRFRVTTVEQWRLRSLKKTGKPASCDGSESS